MRVEASFEREEEWSDGMVLATYRSTSCAPCDPAATVTGWKIR